MPDRALPRVLVIVRTPQDPAGLGQVGLKRFQRRDEIGKPRPMPAEFAPRIAQFPAGPGEMGRRLGRRHAQCPGSELHAIAYRVLRPKQYRGIRRKPLILFRFLARGAWRALVPALGARPAAVATLGRRSRRRGMPVALSSCMRKARRR